MRLNRLLHGTGLRVALLYAALFGASVLMLFGVVYWKTAGYMEQQLRETVRLEIELLMARYGESGLLDLRRAVQERVAVPHRRATSYLLLDGRGQLLAGNLPALNLGPGWKEIDIGDSDNNNTGDAQSDNDRIVLGRALPLADGALLFVGTDARQLQELRELLLGALGWGLGITLVLALAGGAIMGAGLRRRVDTINRIAGEIVAGNLDRRIPTRGTDDEFDLLARHLNRMLDRIQALMEDLRQVSNDIAHDLRTPLSRLRQRLEGARRAPGGIADYQGAIDQAILEADRILETFGALLRIAQIESGERRARFTGVDLSAVLETLLEAYAPVAEEGGRTLRGDIAGNARARGDRDLLTQLFANLIENALCHTPAGSRIELGLTATSGGPVVTVADDGPGIPAAARDKVLQRFFRLEASRSTPGSGLGLSLVAAVAELHGATLGLGDNNPGLRVTVQFPAHGDR